VFQIHRRLRHCVNAYCDNDSYAIIRLRELAASYTIVFDEFVFFLFSSRRTGGEDDVVKEL